jgi:hypothetical protein
LRAVSPASKAGLNLRFSRSSEPNVPFYYFDSRDGDSFLCDEDGLEFPSLEAARDQATAALADMAKDVLPGSLRRELIIEVSDENREPVLRTSLVFEAIRLR